MSELSHVGMTTCFYCGEASEILLNTRLSKTLPRNVGVISMRPCNKCEGYMRQGVILIGYDEGKTDFNKIERDRANWKDAHDSVRRMAAPGTDSYVRRMKADGYEPEFIPRDVWRTGQFAVVKDAAITRMVDESLCDRILKARWTFVPGPVMEKICPREEQPA